jgi:adenine deaminase
MPDFERPPLHQMTRELAATAMGRLPATLVVRGGTLVSVTSGEILPNMSVAGLMSPEPYEEVGERSKAIGEALVRAGCRLNNAFMTLSFLALVVHPELHVSDKGLVGVGEAGLRVRRSDRAGLRS